MLLATETLRVASCMLRAAATRNTQRSRLREALDRFRLAVVNAEHRQQVGQAQRLPHAVLWLEQAERRAEALRGLEALHQLSQTVAVDVVHLRKVEEDLARPVVEELLDQAREHLLADAGREAALEVDDDHVALLASLDVHAAGSY